MVTSHLLRHPFIHILNMKRNSHRRMYRVAVIIFWLFFPVMSVGCSLVTPIEEIDLEIPGEQIPIRITAGDQELKAYLYENGTAQTFAGLLPLTAELWTPADYARACPYLKILQEPLRLTE